MKTWVKLFIVMTLVPKIALMTKPVDVLLEVKAQGFYFTAYEIDWMDGSRSFQASLGEDDDVIGSFSRTHTYRVAGEFPVTVKLYRDGKVVKAISQMLILKGVEQ